MVSGRQVGAAAAVVAVALSLGACSHRLPDSCSITCGADSACPDGFTCATDGFCHGEDDPEVCLVVDRPDGAAGDPDAFDPAGDGDPCDGAGDRVAGSDPRDVAIPDGDTVGVDRAIELDAACVTVDSIQVRVEIVHEYRGDIEIRLTSPAGQSALLKASGDDPTPDVFATFEVDLATGESAAGEWLLNVRDVFETDLGTLQFWSIGINMPAP